MEFDRQRRRFLQLTGTAVGLGATASAAGALTDAEEDDDADWPMPGHDVAGTRYVDADAPTSVLNSTHRRRVGGYPGVAVVDDTVYVAGRTMTAFRRDDGLQERKWVRDASTRWDSPWVVDGTVYSTDDGVVHALAAADGSEEWTFPTGTRYGFAMPTADAVYVVATDYSFGQNEEDGTVYALDPDTGSKRWEQTVPRLWSTVVAGGNVVATSGEKTVYSLSGEAGTTRWKRDLDRHPWTVVADDGRAFVSQKGRFSTLALDTGDLEWRHDDVADDAFGRFAVAPDALYFAEESAGLSVHDPASGDVLWASENDVGMPLAVTDDAIYFRTRRGLDARSTEDGKLLGQFEPEDTVSTLAVTDGALFVTDVAGAVSRVVDPTTDATTTDATTTADVDAPGPTVDVAPSGELVFEPETLTVEPGTTVTWVWKSDHNNVVVEDQPDDAEWQGTPGDEDRRFDAGYVYEHTFTVPGTYEYYSDVYREAGMVGEVVVTNPWTSTTTSTATTTTPPDVGRTTDTPTTGNAPASSTAAETTSDGQPGMGLLAGLAGVGGASYLLRDGEHE